MAVNAPRPISEEDLAGRFNYHPPRHDLDAQLHADIRGELHRAAVTMARLLPAGREAALVVTKLEEAMFWANAALARARGSDPAARVP